MVAFSKFTALSMALLLPSYAVAAPSKALAKRAEGGPNGYSAYTQSVLIPYSGQSASNGPHGPYLNFKIDGSGLLRGQMDTGSTGFVLVGYHIPNFSKTKGTPGHIYYSSSGNLLTGMNQEHTVTVTNGAGGELLQAKMTVLAVTASCIYKNYPGTGDCTGKNPMSDPATLKSKISNMIGVGFSRGPTPSASGPSKNIFMLASKINGAAVSSKMCPGYVVGQSGVNVGLTTANTAGYAYEKLSSNPRLPSGITDPDWKWKQPSVSFSIGGNQKVAGELLIDTGLSSMLMCVKNSYPKTGYSTSPTTHKVLTSPDALISVDVDGLTGAGAGQEFHMSDISASNTEIPSAVTLTICEAGVPSPTINVGRRFLDERTYMYDAKERLFRVEIIVG